MAKPEFEVNERNEVVVKIFKPDDPKHAIRKDIKGIMGYGDVRGNVELVNALYSSVVMVIKENHAAVLAILDKTDLKYEFMVRSRTQPTSAEGAEESEMRVGNA
ncbi:hypothetical protein HZA44_01375 [Candidatus Peregrinibacteria bacterium]|nr:hypothetical protein [Candidatus Peregrinibacteria bacterium]